MFQQLKNKWFLLCVLFKFFDVLTTYIALQNDGVELNPVVAYLINNLGLINGLLVVFLVFMLAISFVKEKSVFIILLIILIIVVVNNLIAIWALL